MPRELVVRLTKSAPDIRGLWSALLSSCRELRELELVVERLGDRETEIISSITSTSIRKITLVHQWSIPSLSCGSVNWGTFNEPLCRLVDGLGFTHELEVEIRIVHAGGVSTYEDIGPGVIVSSLAAFREKGRIRLVYVGKGERVHVVYPLDPSSPNPPASVC